MSTFLYLTCLDHDPPLIAEDESGQHLSDLPRIRAEIAGRDDVVTEGQPKDVLSYFSRNSERFLEAHRGCLVGIRDEYGCDHPVEEERR